MPPDPIVETMVVEHGKVREFARAVGVDPASPGGDSGIVPPTFLTVGRLLWSDIPMPTDELGFEPATTLHAEEEFDYVGGRMPMPGERLWFSTAIGSQWDKPSSAGGRLRFATVETTFTTTDGAPL